jgi:hypothetical protein
MQTTPGIIRLSTQTECATQQALSLLFTMTALPIATRRASLHRGLPYMYDRLAVLAATQRIHYNGSRWQPRSPRPPQFLRGVSCICTVSAGPPEGLGRSALTVIGLCEVLTCCTRASGRHVVQPEPSRSLKPRQHSSVGDATYPFVLRHGLCHPRQALVVCPVHPAELGYGVVYSETCRVRRAALHHAVDLRERRL